MEEDQHSNRGYVICTQCITEGSVVQQMRPLRDWADHVWYNEAMADPKAATAMKRKKKKKVPTEDKTKKLKKKKKS